MVNVEIYWQRQLVILIHFYLPISTSLSFSVFYWPFWVGLLLPSSPRSYMSHMAFLPSVLLRSFLCLLFTPTASPTVALLSLVYPYPFLISNLIDYVPYLYCLWSWKSLFNWFQLPAVCNFFLFLPYKCFISLQNYVICMFGFSREVMENTVCFHSPKIDGFFSLINDRGHWRYEESLTQYGRKCRHFPEVHFER